MAASESQQEKRGDKFVFLISALLFDSIIVLFWLNLCG